MRIYISGPISGMPDLNQPAFLVASLSLLDRGHRALNPFQNGLPGSSPWSDHMRADIRMLMDSDAVAMLPGWENSRGAKIERQLALDVGIPVKTLAEWLA